MPYGGLSYTQRSSSNDVSTSESFAALGLGFTYRYADRRTQFLADYYGEVTSADGSGSGIDNHGGSLSYSTSLTSRDRLSVLASYTRTTDLQSAPVLGSVTDATTFDTTSLLLTYGRDVTARTGLEITFSGLDQSTDQDSINDAASYALTGRVLHFATPTTQLEGRFGLTRFDLDVDSFNLAHVDVGGTMDLGADLGASGYVGLMRTNADDGRTFGRLGGTLVKSSRNSRLEFGFEREVLAAPGLGSPLLSDRLSVEWDYRISSGLISKLSLENSRLEEISVTDDVTRVLALEGQISYALDNKSWLWGGVSLTRERNNGVRTRDSRISVGVSTNLR